MLLLYKQLKWYKLLNCIEVPKCGLKFECQMAQFLQVCKNFIGLGKSHSKQSPFSFFLGSTQLVAYFSPSHTKGTPSKSPARETKRIPMLKRERKKVSFVSGVYTLFTKSRRGGFRSAQQANVRQRARAEHAKNKETHYEDIDCCWNCGRDCEIHTFWGVRRSQLLKLTLVSWNYAHSWIHKSNIL